jgi:hypothetical protein
LLISQWRHDLAKGKFSTVAAKYAVAWRVCLCASDRQPQLGFGHNEQTLRLGAGVVERATAAIARGALWLGRALSRQHLSLAVCHVVAGASGLVSKLVLWV